MPDRLIISPYGEKDGMLSYLPRHKKICHSHAKISLDLHQLICCEVGQVLRSALPSGTRTVGTTTPVHSEPAC